MRVLISGYSFSRHGGVGTFQSSLIFGYLERGWEVHVLAMTEKGDMWDEICSSCHGHDLTSQVLSVGKVLQVANFINNVAPDLIIINHTPLLNYALPFIRGGIRVSVLHSDDPVFYAAAALHSDYLDAWVAPTPGVKERFAKWIPRRRSSAILLIPHGVDTSIFYPDCGLDVINFNVTFVGYIGFNKGVDLLPAIFKGIALSVPEVSFNIVGDGPLKVEISEKIKNLGILNRCSWHGVKEQAAVAEILRKSTVCLHPTRIEGFGLVIVEAMLSGAVPVVSRIGGVTDYLIEDKTSGYLVEMDDVVAFVNSASMILNDQHKYKSMRSAALKRGKTLFSRELMLSKYESLSRVESDRLTSPVCFARWAWETFLEIPFYRIQVPKFRLK